MNFFQQFEKLEQDIVSHIVGAIKTNGVESEFINGRVISIKDESLMFNISGERFLKEITETVLLDNYGYSYNYNAIDLEQLAQIADSIKI